MKKNIVLLSLLICFVFCTHPPKYFSGEIIYKYEFRDANGNDITEAMTKVTSKEQYYFINEKNYKAYDEDGNLTQVYNSDSNLYYQVTKNNLTQKIDASVRTSKIFTVNKLKSVESVAGFKCNTIEIITDDATTTYFYTPLIKISPTVYQKHSFGEWNKILDATDGALPLKFKLINNKQGFIVWVSTAIKLKKLNLADSVFQLPLALNKLNN